MTVNLLMGCGGSSGDEAGGTSRIVNAAPPAPPAGPGDAQLLSTVSLSSLWQGVSDSGDVSPNRHALRGCPRSASTFSLWSSSGCQRSASTFSLRDSFLELFRIGVTKDIDCCLAAGDRPKSELAPRALRPAMFRIIELKSLSDSCTPANSLRSLERVHGLPGRSACSNRSCAPRDFSTGCGLAADGDRAGDGEREGSRDGTVMDRDSTRDGARAFPRRGGTQGCGGPRGVCRAAALRVDLGVALGAAAAADLVGQVRIHGFET